MNFNWNFIRLSCISNYVISGNYIFLPSCCTSIGANPEKGSSWSASVYLICICKHFPQDVPTSVFHCISSRKFPLWEETLELRARQEDKKSYLNSKEPPFQVVNKSLVLSGGNVDQSKQEQKPSHFFCSSGTYSKSLTGCQWASVQEPADSQRWAGMFYLAIWEEPQPYGGDAGQYSLLYVDILEVRKPFWMNLAFASCVGPFLCLKTSGLKETQSQRLHKRMRYCFPLFRQKKLWLEIRFRPHAVISLTNCLHSILY